MNDNENRYSCFLKKQMDSASHILALLVFVASVAGMGCWLLAFTERLGELHLSSCMKLDEAVILFLSSVGLLFVDREKFLGLFSKVCAALVLLLGSVSFAHGLVGGNWGALFDATNASALSHPEYVVIEPVAAVMCLLLGGALFLLSYSRTVRLAQLLVIPVGLMGLLTWVSYFYCAMAHTNHVEFTPFTRISAVLFILLSIGIFLRHPHAGLARMVTGDTLGGWVFRRLFPVVMATPFAIGWLQLIGEGRGWVDSGFRIAFVMVSLMAVLGVALWRVAIELNRVDAARHQAELRLQESERSYRDQFIDSSVPMIMIDPDGGGIVEANAAALAFYGYSATEMKTKYIMDLNPLPPEEISGTMKTVREGRGGRFEFKHRLADGSLRDIAAYTSRIPFGNRVVLHSIIIDVTDRKIAERELRNSEEKYRLLTDNNVSAVAAHRMVFDASGNPIDYIFLSANPAFEDHTGLSLSRIIGRNASEVIPGIEKTEFFKSYVRVVQTGVPESFEHYSEQLGRSYFVHAYRLDDGCFATAFMDVTERKKAEAALKEREMFLARLIETVPIPVFYKAMDGRYVLVNKAFETMFWKSKDELIGHTVFDVLPLHLAQISHEEDKKLYDNNLGTTAYYSQVEDGMGVVHDVIFQKAAVFDPDGKPKGLIGAILNITDQKHLEEELRVAQQRLEDLEAAQAKPAKKQRPEST